ncbi:hypothetical protein Bca4012_005468 [Brassica carinata]
MVRLHIHQTQERGNISTRYTQILLQILGMSILGYAPMDLVHLECLVDNILCGQSFFCRTIYRRICAWNKNFYF